MFHQTQAKLCLSISETMTSSTHVQRRLPLPLGSAQVGGLTSLIERRQISHYGSKRYDSRFVGSLHRRQVRVLASEPRGGKLHKSHGKLPIRRCSLEERDKEMLEA